MARVRPAGVVEVDVAADAFAGGAHGFVGMEVDLLVLDRAPHPFDEHVVAPAALAVHRDADAVAMEQPSELAARKLTALIGVEDLRFAVPGDRLLDRFGAERRVNRGSPPNTSAALAISWFFQSVIWLGCTSCCCASSASVLSPRTAASATLALNAAECVRRGLLLILAPVLTGDVLAFRSSVHPHRAVQFCGASSNGWNSSFCRRRRMPMVGT